MKVIEWNINHRIGHLGTQMPTWVRKVIQEKSADIIVLTETSRRVPNWDFERNSTFGSDRYYMFESQNSMLRQNDVSIAISKEFFEVENVFFYPSYNHKNPDNLEIDCIEKKTNKKITVVGIRIHDSASNKEKREELHIILDSVASKDRVILVGDFNNYRRGFLNKDWCLNELRNCSNGKGFNIYTPDGGSIYTDNSGDYSFPEDHILTKGKVVIEKLYDYDRGFVSKDPIIYKWGRDFQKYIGKDDNNKPIYESIIETYPDHAILEADFKLVE